MPTGGMLTAFKAQAIHELKPKDRAKIESLLAYGDRLLVGLNTGWLKVYRVNETSIADHPADNADVPPPSPSKTKAIELLRDVEKFSKKPIQQLAIIKEVNVLVSLSDAYVSLHDLQTYELVDKLERSKGATCFTVTSNVVKDPDTGVPGLVSRLAVGAKRRIVCWTWQDMEQLPDVTEVSLEMNIRSLLWSTGTQLVAGMDAGFSAVDVETLDITPINRPASRVSSDTGSAELAGIRFGAVSSSGMSYMVGGWTPKPMATGLSDGQVLLAKDVNTLFADNEGKALEKRQVPWSAAPEAIGYSYPYLLALQAPERGALQVRNPDTLSLLQTIPVPLATILHVPPPNISLAHAGKRFLVASERVIWRMNALPYDSQLTQLVDKQRYDEAISLLNLLEDTLIDEKAKRIREIKIQKATGLFRERKYRASLDLFTDADASPDRVIKLYPRSIAGDLSELPEEPEDDAQPESVEESDAKTEDAPKEPPATPGKSLLDRVTGHARKEPDNESIKSSAVADSAASSPHKRNVSKPTAPEKALVGEDLKVAVWCLTSFLAQARIEVQKYLNPDGTLKENPPVLDPDTGQPAFANLLPQDVIVGGTKDIDWQAELLQVAQLVYTSLFRSYMLASPSLAGSLFRIDNFCDPEVVQASLYESHRYNDLIDFLHGKKLHRQALEMLMKFGKGEADGEVPEGMQGPERTVAYLKQLPPELIDLILEFAAWPVREKPEVGMDVFLADTDNAERLPREKVLHFLADIDERLEVRYLDHIINELGDQTPRFHQQLVDCYLQELKSPTIGDDGKQDVRQKLEAFLRTSKEYKTDKTLAQLPTDDPLFFEIRAIVLSAMGAHEQVLTIYVFQMHDYDKAEAYCTKTYYLAEEGGEQSTFVNGTTTPNLKKPHFQRTQTQVSKDKPNIFATLLRLYLKPPSPNDATRWPQALDLLSRHGARLPASSTLNMMPDDLALAKLEDYFRGRLRHSTAISRQERIVRTLESARLAKTERLLRLGTEREIEQGKPGMRSRRVRITEEDHCRVCHKRFGAAAIRVHPDGEVVHYGCGGKREREGGFG
ncbi:vacuolar sorting protein 39 domain 2-domain-containing protein [Neohortaea acidophila]|uniref:Vacuolar sorting protein 39 domain 2-domain-containing protein n=1 Tax=Neohortaea acidophila TaxID=245834 RepID=A0A6A6PG87_9PEZI|nr:vacuolar sorting protein 39 domain 2-domain-containing protein [Neohortaea acidophila]KAF2478979.1 vacuolar sorting protein 39 domain 2-domain-containing protein [Neohortaea acidophila]